MYLGVIMDENLNNLIYTFDETCHSFSEFIDYQNSLYDFFSDFSKTPVIYENELDIINHELNIFNFKISNGKLIKLNSGDCFFNDIYSFSDECIYYFQNKSNSTENLFLKSFYSYLLYHIFYEDMRKSNIYYKDYREYCLKLYDYFKIKGFSTKNDFFCLREVFINLLKGKKFPKKEYNNVVNTIITFLKDGEINFGIKLNLIEVVVTMTKIFKKDKLKFLVDYCWEYSFEDISNEMAIKSLEIGKSIVKKLQNDDDFENRYNWDFEIAKTYENLTKLSDINQLLKFQYYTQAILFYEKSGEEDKVKELYVKFTDFKDNFDFESISNRNINEDCFSEDNIEIKHDFFIDSFLDYLVYYDSWPLLSIVTNSNEYYEEYKNSSLAELLNLKRIRMDNNNNIISILDSDKSYDEKVKEFNYKLYKEIFPETSINLNNFLSSAFENGLWSFENLYDYLDKIPIFSNYTFYNQNLKDLFEPILIEYFKQFEFFLSDNNPNFMLFIDSIVSKLELVVRLLCKVNNIKTVNIFAENLTTSEMLLNHFFHENAFIEFIDESDFYFLKTILLPEGLNLRNKSAHCLDFSIFCFSNANLLMLCFLRLLKYFD